jgi:hypothetical protein
MMYTDNDLKEFENRIDNIEVELVKKENDILEPTLKTKKELETIVYDFVRSKKRKVYGGTAQNKLITLKNPKDGFYPDDMLADIDFYSPHPIEDAMELVNIIINKGYNYVSATEAIHNGTYTVFAEYENVADISYVPNNIYHRMPFIESNGIYYASPSFVMIDLFRMLCDPLTSGTHRWRKAFPRMVKLQKHYPFNKATSKLPELDKLNKLDELNKYLNTTFDFLKNNSSVILTGNSAYNYFLKESTIMTDNNVGKKYRVLNIPYFEFISINYKNDGRELYKRLREEAGIAEENNITITEYYPFWQFLGYSAIIKYKEHPIANIIHYNKKCTPIIADVKSDLIGFKFNNTNNSNNTLQIASFDVNLLICLILTFKYRVNKENEKYNYRNIMTSHLIEMRNFYLKKNKKTMFDNTPFQEFKTDCIGATMNSGTETRILRAKRIKAGKGAVWSYRPEKTNLKEPTTSHVFMNSSGNEVNNIKNLKLLDVDELKDNTIINTITISKNSSSANNIEDIEDIDIDIDTEHI